MSDVEYIKGTDQAPKEWVYPAEYHLSVQGRLEKLQSAIAKHRDTSLRYGISRSIDRELWEVLDNE